MVSFRPPHTLSKVCGTSPSPYEPRLFAQAQAGDKTLVSGYILFAEVGQETSPLPDEPEQAALRAIIAAVCSHVLRQLIDPLRQQGYLYLSRAGVTLTRRILLDRFTLVQVTPQVLNLYIKKKYTTTKGIDKRFINPEGFLASG
jgi:hypothetical protein